MLKRPFLLLALFLSFFSLTSLKADSSVKYHYPPSSPIISMSFPSDWKMLKKTEGFVRLSSPGEEVYIDVWLLKNDDDSSHVHSIDDIIAEMNEWCNDVHYTRDESADYNQDGIQMLGYSGIGTLKNSSAASHGKQNFYGHAFSPTAKSRFMVVTIRDETAPADTWQETIKDIIKSIQVVNP